ncbi:hypothetical protein BJX66DRAFT_332735 [Aspergillus keveii]|uniref:Uncharacterized protein n=1 Tax=Aspergillus keveii TaxID=714993 RepID=A0ABR4GKU7_9EURO
MQTLVDRQSIIACGEVERREKGVLGVLKRAPLAVSLPIPGQQQRQMGMNEPNQQATIQQRQQQQGETLSESVVDLFDTDLHSLSPAEYENVCRIATAIRNKTSQNDMTEITLTLQKKMCLSQKDYIYQKGMDLVTYYFRCKALKHLQRRPPRATSNTHSSGEATPRDTNTQNDDLSGPAHPQFFIRPSSSRLDENAPHDGLMSISTPGMEVGDADAHNVSELAEDLETYRRQVYGPENVMQYVPANVVESLWKQGLFHGWKAAVTVKDRIHKVYQLYV